MVNDHYSSLFSFISIDKIDFRDLYINLISEFIGIIASIFVVYFIVERVISKQKEKDKLPLLYATKKKMIPLLSRIVLSMQTYSEKKRNCKNGTELMNLTKYFYDNYFFPIYSDIKSDFDISIYVLPHSTQKNIVEILNNIEILFRNFEENYFTIPHDIESNNWDFIHLQISSDKIFINIANCLNEISIEFEEENLKTISLNAYSTFEENITNLNIPKSI